MFPFRWLVRLSFRHIAGLYRHGDSLLYVSRGTGTWGPPLRFLAPEVTFLNWSLGPADELGHPLCPSGGAWDVRLKSLTAAEICT
jgi:hypothetical protein